ncbi:MAG: hypothetical protein GXO02_02700 [Epsilonproteobacteria bacterium]|nr:hypothetical protein [Campylobacterota bacterium]
MLIAHCGITFENFDFLEDENDFFMPKNEVVEAIESALLFYFTKRDRKFQNFLKRSIFGIKKKSDLKELAKVMREELFRRYEIEIDAPKKIYLEKDNIERVEVRRFEYDKGDFSASFSAKIYKGVIKDIKITSKYLDQEKIKLAFLGYSQALANYEHKRLKGSILEKYIANLQNTIANEWESALRVGAWTKSPSKGDLLFFWRIKEVREYLLREFGFDILPRDTFFVPKYKEFLGWCEWSCSN